MVENVLVTIDSIFLFKTAEPRKFPYTAYFLKMKAMLTHSTQTIKRVKINDMELVLDKILSTYALELTTYSNRSTSKLSMCINDRLWTPKKYGIIKKCFAVPPGDAAIIFLEAPKISLCTKDPRPIIVITSTSVQAMREFNVQIGLICYYIHGFLSFLRW